MDQDKAKTLFDNGATFLLLDLPINSEFGIDYNSWRVGANFRGVKMIPPGIHFIYYSVVDKQCGGLGIRNGFFYNFKVKEIVLKRWNVQAECVDTRQEVSEDDLERVRLNKQDLDRFLAPYPYDEYKKWIALSNYLNETMLMRLIPLSGIITSETALVGQTFKKSRSDKMVLDQEEKTTSNLDDLFQKPKSLKDAESLLPKMSETEGTEIRFTKVEHHKYPTGANASAITAHSIDMSFYLDDLLSKIYESRFENILCELQFAFICFLIGYMYDAFEQWKMLVNLLCNSEKIIEKHANLYLDFIQILYFQLKEIPEDFFTDITTKNNFLIICLHNLFDNIESIAGGGDAVQVLKKKSAQFKEYLKEMFSFDFDEEPDEYAPTICGEEEA